MRITIIFLLIVLFASCDSFQERRRRWKELKAQKGELVENAPDTVVIESKAMVAVEIDSVVVDSVAPVVDSKPVIVQEEVRFYVIIGSFATFDEADKLYNQSKGKFDNASLVYDNDNEKVRVSVDSFLFKDEANNYLKKVKAQFPDAWILAK